MRQKPQTFILFILVSLASVAGFIYTPALPEMKGAYGVGSDTIQWTVTTFLVAYALSQLVYAPLANRFQRKKAIYLGILISALGVILCILSTVTLSFTLLLVGLFVTSLGASAGLSLTFTIINDYYDHHESRKVIPLVTLSFAMMPGIAVFAGGILTTRLQWPACFWFMLVYFALVAILVRLLPETGQASDQAALKIQNILRKYLTAAKSAHLWICALIWGFCTALVYIFAAIAPLLVIDGMGVTAEAYGRLNMMNTIGLVAGTIFAMVVTEYLSVRFGIYLGLVCSLAGGILLLLVTIAKDLSPFLFFLCSSLVFFGIPAIFSNATSTALSEVEDKATGSSLLTFIDLGSCVLLLAIIGSLPGKPEEIFVEGYLAVLAALLISVVIMDKEKHVP